MKKIIALILTFSLCLAKAKSQDIILKTDKTELKVKVLEITLDGIVKYKAFDNLEGPTYSIAHTDFIFIVYANGKKEYIMPKVAKPTEPVVVAPSFDNIVKTDKTEVKAKIIEITNDAIKYKPFDNVEGPIYSLPKNEVYYVLYANGKKDYLEEPKVINKPVELATTPTAPMPDAIIKNDKLEVKARVVDVNDFEVYYKLSDAANEPTRSVSKLDIAAIKYAKDSKYYMAKPISKTEDAAADSIINLADTILQKNNSKVTGKIVNTKGIALQYKKMDNADDATYFVPIANVVAIEFAGGVRQNFESKAVVLDAIVAPIIAAPVVETPLIAPPIALPPTLPDEIIKTDKTELKVKVIDVVEGAVRYKLFTNLEGPTYSTKLENVVMINYANGKRFFPEQAAAPQPVETPVAPVVVKQFAPDIIIKNDKTEIKAKVLDIEQNDVKYKKSDNIDGPAYFIKKAEIMMISYADGKRWYSENEPTQQRQNLPTETVPNTQGGETSLDALEPGIYWYNGKEYIELDPTNVSNSKSGGFGEVASRALISGLINAKTRVSIGGNEAAQKINTKSPVFYIVIDVQKKGFNNGTSYLGNVQTPNDFFVVQMKVVKNTREIVTGKHNTVSNDFGIDDKIKMPFKYQKVKKGFYKVELENKLDYGEYCFMFASSSLYGSGSRKVYDFSIQP